MATKSPSDHGYMIYRPEKAGFFSLFSLLLFRRRLTSYGWVEGSNVDDSLRADWIVTLTLLIQKVLAAIDTPMKWTGYILEFLLNLFALNGGLLGLIWKTLTGKLVIPRRDAANFRSILGFIDPRVNLYDESNSLLNYFSIDEKPAGLGLGDISLVELTTMAAKVAYENAAFIKDAVTNHWNMHFVGFFDCWNKFLDAKTTQAFIFCNKAEDADLIVVAFRGTEPFSAQDWSTDVDLSWIAMGKLGFLHLGFLKALGLQDEKIGPSGFPKDIEMSSDKPLAYYALRQSLRDLLKVHKRAKIVVTGHSLGGALAAVFPALLSMHNQTDILSNMQAVMTYGQPRVGDLIFAKYVDSFMHVDFRRMVYRYDIVPRIPFDSPPVALFKHCGVCIYYNGWYTAKVVDEVPNKNYFDPMYAVNMYWNAWGDLLKGLFIGRIQGKDFAEGWVSILFRATGLVLPGIASHSPRDYVNGARLSKLVSKSVDVV